MANTYYDSELTAEEIEEVLEAINGILTPANNGKVLAINNGKFEARSVQWGGGGAVVQPLSVTQNGTYNPPSGVDGYAPVTVNVSGGGGSSLYDILDYIESDGTQVIDTLRTVSNGDSIRAHWQFQSGVTNYAWFFGAISDGGFFGCRYLNNLTQVFFGDSSGVSAQIPYAYDATFEALGNTNQTVSVFAFHDTSAFINFSKMRFYSLMINNVMFIPCRRKADGICGLYDTGNNTFLTDSNGGNPFIAGPVIPNI